MSDAGISSVILVIVTLIVAITIGGVFIQVSDSISRQIQQNGQDTATQIASDLTIVSGSQFIFNGTDVENNTTVLVKNTGSTDVQVISGTEGQYNTFINGQFVQANSATVLEGDSQVWTPSDTARFRFENATEVNCFEDNSFEISTRGKEDDVVFYADCS